MQRTHKTSDTPGSPKPKNTEHTPKARVAVTPVIVNMNAKAQRSQRPIVVILVSLAWIAICLSGLLIGTNHNRNSAGAQIHAAEIELNDYLQNRLDTESKVNTYREKVLSTALQRRSFETHNACLARAISTAHNQGAFVPYEDYPEVVDDMISWADNVCGQLVFSPQVPIPQAQSLLEHPVAFITEVSSRLYQWVTSIDVDSVVGGVMSIKDWVVSRTRREATLDEASAPKFDNLAGIEEILLEQTIRRYQSIRETMTLHLPPNYSFRCREDSVCRLTHTQHFDRSRDASRWVAHVQRDMMRLRKRQELCANLYKTLYRVWFCCMFTAMILMSALSCPTAGGVPRALNSGSSEKEIRYMLSMQFMQLVAYAISEIWSLYWAELQSFLPLRLSRLALGFSVTGIFGLAIFFAPGRELGFWELTLAFKDLIDIWILEEAHVVPEIRQKRAVKIRTASTSVSANGVDSPPSSMGSGGIVTTSTSPPPPSPRSSLFEDIELERKIMREEQEEASNDVSPPMKVETDETEDAKDSPTELETESETESSSESEWAVV
jgi:hypothetical protein